MCNFARATCVEQCTYTDDPQKDIDYIKMTDAGIDLYWIVVDLSYNEDTCPVTLTNHYSWPDYPRRTGTDLWRNKIYDRTDYWEFEKRWTSEPWEPYLFLMTHEDAAGKIYSSAYFLMVIEGESGYSSSSDPALTTMLTTYKREVCS